MSKIICFLFVFVFSIVLAFRPLETKDTFIYYLGFYNVNLEDAIGMTLLQKYDNNFEFGYILLMHIFKFISDDFRLFFFTCAFVGIMITLYSLFFITKRISNNESISYATLIFLYYSAFALHYNGIAIRAGLAIAIGLFAIVQCFKKNFLLSILLAVIAFSIQRSCIVLLIVYFVYKYCNKLPRVYYYIIFCIQCILMFSNFGSLLMPAITSSLMYITSIYEMSSYSTYLEYSSNTIAIKHTFFLMLFGYIVVLCKSNNNSDCFSCLNVLMIGASVISIMHTAHAVSRLYEFFYIFSVPLLASNLKIIHYKIGIKSISIIVVSVMNYIILLHKCLV